MNPFTWFSRPAWQARDPARRSAAVAHGRDEMLVAALPLILRQDPDSAVRRAALERIDDLTLVADRMSNDADPALRERAKVRFGDLLIGKAPLSERQRALKLIDDQIQLEGIARRAPETELRRAALERCTRPGFLVERCLEEADAELKLWLLSRIDARPSLDRIAAHARTRDKRLYKAVRERLDGERMAAGDAPALNARAETLCATIEARLRQPGSDAAGVLNAVETEWATLRPRLDERFDRRFAGAVATLRATIGAISRIGEPEPAPVEGLPPEVVGNAQATMASAELEAVLAPASPPSEPRTEADPLLAELLAEAQALRDRAPTHHRDDLARRWRLHWASEVDRPEPDQALSEAFEARLVHLRARDAERAVADDMHRAVADTAIAALAEAVDAGQLAVARAVRARARSAIDSMSGESGRSIKKQLAELEPRIDKLAQWQRWSDNKIRLRLCEEVEALAGNGMHPDALASRIAELKAQWQKIEDSEHDPGTPVSDGGLGGRFRYLCHQTLEPAKPYFEKRREIRGKRAEELSEFLERVRLEMAAEATTTVALIALKRESADRIRRVDEIDPKLRGDSGRQLKQLIDALSKAVDARFSTIAEEKQKLIAQLRRQLTHAELDAAIELAKGAQRRWQALPKGTQKSDQVLWQELRTIIDPLFEQKVAAGNAANAERDTERAASQALVDELKALGENIEFDAAHLEAELARLEAIWSADPARPRELERAFDESAAKVRQLAARRREQQQSARQNRVGELAYQLDTIEAAWLADASAVAGLDTLGSLDGVEALAAAALNERIARLRTALATAADSGQLESQAQAARKLLLEYEFLAGVESPPGDRQSRLNLQVEKLSARMSSGQSRSPAEERAALDLRWWATGPLATAEREALSARLERALPTK